MSIEGVEEGRVEAGGGLFWRRAGEGGRVEVLLVHRPHYDDWSIPKGKLKAGEAAEAAAVREVEEETGLVGRLGAELPSTSYVDRQGRPKRVRYWAMTASGQATAANEVDEVRWFGLDDACRCLSYERDVPVVEALGPLLGL